MTDTALMIFHTDNRFMLAKVKNGARVPVTKSYQDPVKRVAALYKLDIVLDDEIKLKVHNVESGFNSRIPRTRIGIPVRTRNPKIETRRSSRAPPLNPPGNRRNPSLRRFRCSWAP